MGCWWNGPKNCLVTTIFLLFRESPIYAKGGSFYFCWQSWRREVRITRRSRRVQTALSYLIEVFGNFWRCFSLFKKYSSLLLECPSYKILISNFYDFLCRTFWSYNACHFQISGSKIKIIQKVIPFDYYHFLNNYHTFASSTFVKILLHNITQFYSHVKKQTF